MFTGEGESGKPVIKFIFSEPDHAEISTMMIAVTGCTFPGSYISVGMKSFVRLEHGFQGLVAIQA
jgi:hypothetical protein